ncbi:MAG: AAA family ATPase [Catonella sp.]|uniref:AAA family ATPase n=1 Tax=Catonella sp. TaxID=2382125 RepID=UPI003FA062DE
MYTNAGQVFDIAKANYRTLVGYCSKLESEGYFMQAEKILHKTIFQTLDLYIQSMLINIAIYGGKLGEDEVKFIVSLPDSKQYDISEVEDISNEIIRQAESVVKSPPIIMQLCSLRDREKNSNMSSAYMDMMLNIIVAMSYLNANRDEFLPQFIMDYYHSVQAFIFFSDRAERINERYLFRKASGDITMPGEGFKDEDVEEKKDEAVPILKEVRANENVIKNEELPKQAESEPIPLKEEDRKKRLDELVAELEALVGLDDVKTEVHSLINLINIRQLRKNKGLPSPAISYHMVFTGSPGTGKTTVARLIAGIYKELGVLSKGGLVEVDRSGLVAGYVGQTALKVTEVVNKALGGVLFIDEAYSLSAPGAANDFGGEAIDTLVKLMEDHRNDLVVIVAGYTKEMNDFLQTNTGLISRFNKFIEFKDYNEDDLIAIMDAMSGKMEMKLEDKAVDKLRNYLSRMNESSKRVFGNARGIRNLFEKMLVGQANRLSHLEEPTIEDLSIITAEDFEF